MQLYLWCYPLHFLPSPLFFVKSQIIQLQKFLQYKYNNVTFDGSISNINFKTLIMVMEKILILRAQAIQFSILY